MEKDQTKALLQRITIVPGLMGGKPTIRGMRFRVSDMLDYLSAGMTNEEILADFPYLELKDIYASLLYAANKLNHPVIVVDLNAA